MGLVCFRLRGSDQLNKQLLSDINASGRIHMVPASVNEKYVIRFCAVAQNATLEDIRELKMKRFIISANINCSISSTEFFDFFFVFVFRNN